MVLRGNQIQRCGPAGCVLLTSQALLRQLPKRFPVASAWCSADTVLPRPDPFVPSIEVQSGDGVVHFTYHDPNCSGHRARPLSHAPWPIRKGGSHVLSLQQS